MKCRRCQFDSPPGMKFCGQCGAKLAVVCPNCGTEPPAGFKFCGECGTRLPAAEKTPGTQGALAKEAPQEEPKTTIAPPPTTVEPVVFVDGGSRPPTESELKQATVLCGELVFQPATGLDPELTHDLLNRFFELARKDVRRYGGSVKQFHDHGLMALFGVPTAYEDHARRALLAALGLNKRVAQLTAELEQRHGIGWSARIGLASGSVVVGGVGDMAVGEATTRARQLERLAEPGTVLIDSDASRLLRPFVELEAVISSGVGKGESPVVEGWKAGRLRPEIALATSGKARSNFVGRTRELALLDELRTRAELGEGQLVAIAGEAGSGKSRLLFELRQTLKDGAVSYLRGQCLSFGSGVPYLPLVDMIRKASRISESDDDSIVTDKLRTSLDLVGTDHDSVLPYLLRLLGVREDAGATDGLEPQALQQRTFAAMRRMLLDAGRVALVVVEIEDIHWIDETSERFVDSLVEVIGAARILLLLTYRSGDSPRWLEKSYATQITLHRLSTDESRRLVDAVLLQDKTADQLRAENIPELLEKAEGNPLFLEELAHALVGTDAAHQGAIPDTVQGILMARIDRLPETHKRLLRTASVLGRSVPLDLLQAIWTRPEPLEPLLEDLRRQEFLYKAPSEEQTLHFFKHALIQEVAYESLLSQRRRELHRLAAVALEELYTDRLEDAYDRLIYHYPRAGEPEKTVNYLTLFAARAARHYAHAEAAKALRQALEHAEQLPSESRDRRTIEVLLQLADSLLPLAHFPETLDLCLQHRDRVEQLEDPRLSAQYHFWLAHTYTYLGDQEATRQQAQFSIAAAQACGDETTEGKACYVLGRNGFWSGQFAEGIQYSLRAVVLLERSGEPWWQGQAYWVAGFNHYVLGEIEKGLSALERAYEIGEALDDYRLDTSWSLGYFYASLGDWETGIDRCQRGLDRAQDPLNSAVATGFLGYAYLEKGDLDEAISTLSQSVESLRVTGMQQILGWFTIFLSEAHLITGDVDKARELAELGLKTTQEAEFHYGVGLSLRTLGRVELAGGRIDNATRHLDRAFATFTSLTVPFEAARTHLERARAAHQQGRHDDASHELAEARRLFDQLRVPAYVERTQDLATELNEATVVGLLSRG